MRCAGSQALVTENKNLPSWSFHSNGKNLHKGSKMGQWWGGRGGRAEGGGAVCGMGKNDKAVMEALSEEVTFEQRPE